MPYSHILFDVDDAGIALITVNRPQKLNALSGEVVGELGDAFERVAGHSAIRAAILTGAGEKAFVAGADINELAAMACTVRFASENAKLGQPEVKLGIVPGYGGTQRLPRLVGRGRALELLLAGDPISAAEAHRIGLVNAVVDPGELLNHSRGWLQ